MNETFGDSLISLVKKIKPEPENKSKEFVMHLHLYCLNGCKYRCDFDKGDDVFCHLIGRDLLNSDIALLKQIGCACMKPKPIEKKGKCIYGSSEA